MNVSAMVNPVGVRGPRARRAAGFTLVEIMIVVVIISMLAAFGIPTMVRMQLNARTAAVTNDFRVFAQVFQAYAHANGSWPEDTAAGVIPPELLAELNNSPWARPTPLGGRYNWENSQLHQGGFRPRAAITITLGDGDSPITLTQMQHIDDFMDDGNLDTGNFRRGAGNAPLYVIEP
jgi:prepilin-type N-terminal cleavage/methylation domain-containing protein